MPMISRLVNLLRRRRLAREIDEELADHLAEAVERGRDPEEARRALGAPLRHREASFDVRLATRLDALRADVVFGWRQLRKSPATSLAAVASLALGIGACTAAFRLVDALLFRPLPIAAPERLHAVSFLTTGRDGRPSTFDSCSYPLFRQFRDVARDRGQAAAASFSERGDLTFGGDADMEPVQRQFVSGEFFDVLGLRPALGRVLHAHDDVTPGGHAVAVLSHDYWMRRFGGDPQAVGRTFRMRGRVYEIVGVLLPGFTGVEPGTFVDLFAPTMMEPDVERSDTNWLRTLIVVDPSQAASLREALNAAFATAQAERVKGFTDLPPAFRARLLSTRLQLDAASAGVSGLQRSYRVALALLSVLVALVLLIACANVANLMAARAGARAREMALRISIGAGRARLVQLLLIESAWIACLASLAGILLAWQAAPAVVGLINPPDAPARLALPFDWRLLTFSVALAFLVTCLFGLAPALRASAVTPSRALRGDANPLSRRRTMHALTAMQAAFCSIVTLIGGTFIATHQRLANQPVGFSSERLLALTVEADADLPAERWQDAARELRETAGVERVSLADRPLLDGSSNNNFISINGGEPGETLSNFRLVSPGWLATMGIRLVDGRDMREREPGTVAIVNERFARTFFPGQNPIGRTFARGRSKDLIEIIGVAADAKYARMRDPILPVAYVPFAAPGSGGWVEPRSFAAFIVRTTANDPLSMGPTLRRRVSQTGGGIRVSDVRTQVAITRLGVVRERLLATLSSCFAAVALLLAGIGLYGVLHYTVLQRRREIAIRAALGSPARGIAWRVVGGLSMTTGVGAAAGLLIGALLLGQVQSLVFETRPGEVALLAMPAAAIAAVAFLAALIPVVTALRIDPYRTLRTD